MNMIELVQQALLSALSSESAVRVSAESFLHDNESSPGFLQTLFKIYVSSTEPTLKLSSLILAKSVISRQWYIPNSRLRPAPVPEDEKTEIKKFLMQAVLFQTESNPKYLEYLILCIGGITKYTFYDMWSELHDYFTSRVEFLNPVEANVLKTLVKTQIRRRMKIRQFKEWAESLHARLKASWVSNQNSDIEKVLLKCLTVTKDPEAVNLLLRKAQSIVGVLGSEENLRSLLKGLNLIENSSPDLFVSDTLILYIEVNYLTVIHLSHQEPCNQPLIRQAARNLRELISTNQPAVALLEPHKLDLLNKCFVEFQHEEGLESWKAGDYSQMLEITENKEEMHLIKLLISILQVYPVLFQNIKEMCSKLPQAAPKEIHAGLVVLALLPEVFESADNPGFTLEMILELVNRVSVEGFYMKVLYRDILIIIRNWLKFSSSFNAAYEAILHIHSAQRGDLIITYECCLSLKELLSYPEPSGLSGSVITHFGREIFKLLSEISIPQMVWNIVSVISLLIDKSASQQTPELLRLFQDAGLNEILVSRTEMIVLALIDMFEGLIRIYPEQNIIVQSSAFFIHTQMVNLTMERVIYLWHFLIASMEALPENLPYADNLLQNLQRLDSRHRGIAVKILEEYLLLYHAAGRTQQQILEFIQSYCVPLITFTRDLEHDSLSMALLVSVSLVDLSLAYHYSESIASYMYIENSSASAMLCLVASVRLINKIAINTPQIIKDINVCAWVNRMGTQSSATHKKLCCVALLKNFQGIAGFFTEIAEAVYQVVVPVVENYGISASGESDNGGNARRKIGCAQLCPSVRKLNYINNDRDTKANLTTLFRQAMTSHAAIVFKSMISAEKNERIEEILRTGHSRSISK